MGRLTFHIHTRRWSSQEAVRRSHCRCPTGTIGLRETWRGSCNHQGRTHDGRSKDRNGEFAHRESTLLASRRSDKPLARNGATVGETAAPNKRRQLRGDWGTGC